MAAPRQAPGQPANATCGNCLILVPTHYCTCTGTSTPTYLCSGCFSAHVEKSPRLPHSILSMDVQVANLSAYRSRIEAFAEGRTELLQNLAKIDQCCADLASAVDHIIAQLGQYRDNLVGQLQAWKQTLNSEISQCVYEVESTLTEEQVQLKGQYSEALRHFKAGSLVLFKYKVDTSAIENCIQYIYSAEYPKPPRSPQAPLLALLTRNEVRLFNFQSLSWGAPVALATPITCNEYSSYTVIEGDRLLCCGGKPDSSASYLVEVRADQCPVTQLPNMNQRRYLAGVIHCEGATYVFGSDGFGSGAITEDMITGEMLTFPPTWTPLPGHMNEPRCSFSPCVYQRNIYLCGARSTRMELFGLVTRCFERLEVQLPGNKSCVVWVDGEGMTVVSWSYRMRVGSAPTTHQEKKFCVNSSAVVYGDSVYWVSKYVGNEGVMCAGKAGLELYRS